MKMGASLVLLVAPTVMACAAAMSDGAKNALKNALKNAHQSAHARIAGGVRLFKRVPPVRSRSGSI
jgi:hypothetical protein